MEDGEGTQVKVKIYETRQTLPLNSHTGVKLETFLSVDRQGFTLSLRFRNLEEQV